MTKRIAPAEAQVGRGRPEDSILEPGDAAEEVLGGSLVRLVEQMVLEPTAEPSARPWRATPATAATEPSG